MAGRSGRGCRVAVEVSRVRERTPYESESETVDGAVDGDEDGFEVDEAADLGAGHAEGA